MIRSMTNVLVAAFVVGALTAQAGTAKAAAMEDAAMEEGEHGTEMFHVVRLEIDGTRNDEGGFVTWDGDGWIGGDIEKFAVRTEGEIQNGHVESSEFWGLYSRNVADFWDLQAGIREDLDPRPETYFVLGARGLARYFFETDAHLFVSKEGDFAARLEQSIDLLVTQRLILEPHMEINVSANNVPEQEVGSGISRIEAGVQLRYEIAREVAPYIDFVYERAVGNTEHLIRSDGGDPEDFTVRAGIRLWF